MRTTMLAMAMLIGGCGAPVTADEAAPTADAQPAAITLTAADGVVVHGVHHRAVMPKALILLFHQAGSSHHEYATIAPRLVAAGYDTLAIDQRSGGAMFGPNRTAAGVGRPVAYEDALADMQAALDWASKRGLPVIVWGSSYSSALVFPLAAANSGRVAGVLAFSPDEYLANPGRVRAAAARVAVPAYLTSSSEPDEIAAAKAIAAVLPSGKATHVAPKQGVHGSSTLLAARSPAAETNWQPVLAFLREAAP